jgi:hypothetical protein
MGVMRVLSTLVPMMAALAVTIVIITFDNILMANAQQLSTQPITLQEEGRTFQSISDSFSVVIPQGWVIQDVSSTDTSTLLAEMLEDYRILARLCPQEQAVLDIGDTYNCEEVQDRVSINEYPNLAEEGESASVANNSLKNEQFLKYQIQKLEEFGYSNINIVNNTDMRINVTITDTNETIAMVPAKLVEMMYSANSTETRGYFLLSATNATSNLGLISGYSIYYEGAATTTPSGSPPVPIKQVFQSFEFVKEGGGGEQDEEPATEEAVSPAAKDGATHMNTTTQQASITPPPPPPSVALMH